MICVFLAAGYATRLYPLTENFPKPLLEVGGRSILDRLTDDLEESGEISEYAVVSNGKFAPHFEKWANGRKEKITVINDGTFTNETRLGAVRDLALAVEKMKIDDDILVIAGDNLTDFSLGRFIELAKEKKASCIMRYFEPDEEKLKKCGVVTIDENDRVLSMTEKSPTPASHWCCPPFYYYKREDVRLIEPVIASGCPVDAPGSLAAEVSRRSSLYAVLMPGRRYDIGNLESYNKVNALFNG